MPIRIVCPLLVFCGLSSIARADAISNLTAKRLEAVHKAVAELNAQRKSLPRCGPYREYRANLHVHSSLSHDSRGRIDEIVAAAKRAGTHVLLFSEHPAEHYDYYKQGHRGTKDGVLLIPGAETQGFLAFPRQSLHGVSIGTPQEFADLVRGRGGLLFLSHLEERLDWNINRLTGTEIYNTHADLKDEKALLSAVKNPFWIITTADLIRRYPQAAFSSLQDYPADYLQRWDELCQRSSHTGIAANDAHQNIGVVARLIENNKVRVEDALGKKLVELEAAAVAALGVNLADKKAGDEVYRLHLDPYENSLRHVGTHLLLTELSEKAVWEALEAGRAFVAFDWLADATGFDFAARAGQQRIEMGSRVTMTNGLRLAAHAPLEVRWKLLRNGKIVTTETGRKFGATITEAGVYRVEAWLPIAGSEMIWILSNPIYVRARDG